jgi:hypothetical protein
LDSVARIIMLDDDSSRPIAIGWTLRKRDRATAGLFLRICLSPHPRTPRTGLFICSFQIGICPPVNISLDVFTDDALKIQEYEKTTRHDVKAIEYFLREKIEAYHSEQRKESPANEQETPRQRTLSENQTTEEQLSSIE